VGVVSARITGRRALVVAFAVAVLLGALASVHTYTFLTGSYVVTFVLAFHGLLGRRGRVPLVAAGVTPALVVALFVAGPRVAADVGPLALLVGGLLPAAPGVLLAIAEDRRILAGLVLAAVGAAPQVVMTRGRRARGSGGAGSGDVAGPLARAGRRPGRRAGRAAGVGYVLTDTGCADQQYAGPALRLVRSEGYRTPAGAAARIELWRLN
jgi:hypothetical protein